jgi:hypothetical protein
MKLISENFLVTEVHRSGGNKFQGVLVIVFRTVGNIGNPSEQDVQQMETCHHDSVIPNKREVVETEKSTRGIRE